MSGINFADIFGSVSGVAPDRSKDRAEGLKAGAKIGFDKAKAAAANKARVLGYESLAKEIEQMQLAERK